MPSARVRYFAVEVSRNHAQGMLGMCLQPTREGLYVLQITPGSVMDMWNARCRLTFPLAAVMRGDLIVRVNGLSPMWDTELSFQAMIAELASATEYLIVVGRLPLWEC